MTDNKTPKQKTQFEWMVDDMELILNSFCDTLNNNYIKLKKQSNLIDTDLCYLFSIYETRPSERNNITRNLILQRLKDNSNFRIISDYSVQELFCKIWNNANICNVENMIYKYILYSHVNGIVTEEKLKDLITIKNNKFIPYTKQKIKEFIREKLRKE